MKGEERREREGTDALTARPVTDCFLLHLPNTIPEGFLFIHASHSWFILPWTLHGGLLLPNVLESEAGGMLKV